MKKLAMLAVKGAVGLVPKAVREKLKSNHKLTELYSRSLQRSGLFYGFPSEKKRMALYEAYLKQQDAELVALERVSQRITHISVIIVGDKRAQDTLESLEQAGVSFQNVLLVSAQQARHDITCFPTISSAVATVTSSLVFFVNSGDTVTHDSLQILASQSEHSAVVYCDSDKLGKNKKRVSPFFLPDWNPELQYSTGYVSTGVLIHSTVLKRADISSCTVAGMVAEIWLRNPEIVIQHVTFTLVHRAGDKRDWQNGLKDVRRVVESFTHAVSTYNEVLSVNHIQWPIKSDPLVSLIIPTKNAKGLVKACIESILEKTTYPHFEILLIDNGSDEQESLDYFRELAMHPKIRVLPYPGAFNYSAINNFGVQHAKGEIVGLVNNDIEVISPDWLTHLAGHAQRDDIGCVGAKLLYSDGRIQHAGVVLGYGGGAGHAHKYFPRYHPGYMKRLVATQNYSAVTAACLLVKKSLFLEVGGLNEKDLTVAFNDVDFCLRVKETGVRNVYCAEAELYHHESVSRGLDHAPEKAARFNKELAYLRMSWGNYISHDPAYSPNLTLLRENFSVKTKEEFKA